MLLQKWFESQVNPKEYETDMKWLNRINSLFLIGLSLLILFSSLKLGIGSLRKPGPGFIPLGASVLVFSLSLWVLITGIRGSAEEQKKLSNSWQNLTKMISLVIGLSFYIYFLKFLGYLIAAFLLLFIMFFIYEPKKWHKHIVVAVLVASLSFFVFRSLGVHLPSGIFRIEW